MNPQFFASPAGQVLLSAMGLDEIRNDAKYTAALDFQLEQLKTQTYDIKYPELKGRTLVPVDTSVDPGAETVAYFQWDEFGMADIISNYADDLGMVDALVEKFFTPVHSLGKAYQYSIQDLRRAAMAGNQLDVRRARACRRAIERKIDDLAAIGDGPAKLYGLLTHPNVPVLTAASDGTGTTWVQGRALPKAPNLIQKDMHTCITTIWSTTFEVHQPNTVILSTQEYGYISQTPVSDVNQTTILKAFLANNPYISNMDFWYKLDKANAAGTGPRMLVYQRDPEILELVIPQDFEQFPPQARNLSFVVPCHARFGGVVIYYPLALIYMDGIG